jgi:hypothetical protein
MVYLAVAAYTIGTAVGNSSARGEGGNYRVRLVAV